MRIPIFLITVLTSRYDEFLERLIQGDPEEKGITFPEFHDFCTFLNNLDDFAIAMKMYTLADRSVSESNISRHKTFRVHFIYFALSNLTFLNIPTTLTVGEFQRAVKICTGASLSQHVVRIVFLIFDQDGDGRLSDREFIAIMRDRIHRGLQVLTMFHYSSQQLCQTRYCHIFAVAFPQRGLGRFQTLR